MAVIDWLVWTYYSATLVFGFKQLFSRSLSFNFVALSEEVSRLQITLEWFKSTLRLTIQAEWGVEGKTRKEKKEEREVKYVKFICDKKCQTKEKKEEREVK